MDELAALKRDYDSMGLSPRRYWWLRLRAHLDPMAVQVIPAIVFGMATPLVFLVASASDGAPDLEALLCGGLVGVVMAVVWMQSSWLIFDDERWASRIASKLGKPERLYSKTLRCIVAVEAKRGKTPEAMARRLVSEAMHDAAGFDPRALFNPDDSVDYAYLDEFDRIGDYSKSCRHTTRDFKGPYEKACAGMLDSYCLESYALVNSPEWDAMDVPARRKVINAVHDESCRKIAEWARKEKMRAGSSRLPSVSEMIAGMDAFIARTPCTLGSTRSHRIAAAASGN